MSRVRIGGSKHVGSGTKRTRRCYLQNGGESFSSCRYHADVRANDDERTAGGGALPATEARPRRPECDEIDPARASPGPGLRAGSSAAQRDQAPPLRPGRGRQSGQAGAARAPRRGLAARPRGLQLDRAAALRSSPGSRTQGVPAPAAGRRTCHLSAPWSARGTGTVERTTWHGTQLTYRPETPAWFTSDRSPCRTV